MSTTATADLETGKVTLRITGTERITSITRADDNGTRPVRLAAGVLPSAGNLTVIDHEPALSGNIQYRVTRATGLEADWVSLAVPGRPQPPRFILPANPLYSVAVETVTDYSAGRVSSSTIHEIIGRPDPVMALGQLRPRTGRLEVFTRTYQEARDLESLFERGQVAMYRQAENPGQDMYLVGTELNTSPTDEALAWLTTITYQELPFPAGPVLSRPDWTFDALAAEYATFEDVAVKFANFNQLTIGEESKQ